MCWWALSYWCLACKLKSICCLRHAWGDGCLQNQLTPEGMAQWAALGLSPGLYVALIFTIDIATTLVFLTMALLTFIMRFDERAGLLLTFMTTFSAVVQPSLGLALAPTNPFLIAIFVSVGWSLFPLSVYLYPDSRYAPYWMRWVALVSMIVYFPATYVAFVAPFMGLPGALPEAQSVGVVAILLFVISAIYSQVTRYRSADSVQKQQYKLALFGLAATVISSTFYMLIVVTGIFTDGQTPGLFLALFGKIGQTLISFIMPVALGMAILRYRLWDIDLVIRRTLQYGVLTALLATVYFMGVTLTQTIFAGVVGSTSTLGVVISTLAIAALFRPLRTRLQRFIDRRFYRSEYDARQTLESFSEQAREEMDPDRAIRDASGVGRSDVPTDACFVVAARSRHNTPEGVAMTTALTDHTTAPIRIRGRWLILARAVWVLYFVAIVVLIAFNIAPRVEHLLTACTTTCGQNQLTQEAAAQWAALGLSPTLYAAIIFAVDITSMLVFFGMGLVVFLLRSNERIGWLMSLGLVYLGFGGPELSFMLLDEIPLVYRFLNDAGSAVAIITLFYLYPDGRFVPGWMRWVGPCACAHSVGEWPDIEQR